MSALLTLDYLAERATRGNRAAFERVLRKVPARAPVPGDEWGRPRPWSLYLAHGRRGADRVLPR